MSNPQLNDLLKWGVENSSIPASELSTSTSEPTSPPIKKSVGVTYLPSKSISSINVPSQAPDPAVLAALFTPQVSDAELMKASMLVLTSASEPVAERVIAGDNLEQLIENLDNARDLQPLGLWTPLLSSLADPEPEVRRIGAWCVATAVQNHVAAQERALAMGAVEALLALVKSEALREKEGPVVEGDGSSKAVRRKAVFALSSLVRNYRPAMQALKEASPKIVGDDGIAEDMESVDKIMDRLRNWDGEE
ncbi:MAG: hypothetical protein M1814_002417 [Vezdaea aestivalis]|nr:MAG: hypothetical protein M1814_002417 [Vezdaea aestivalis]